MIRAHVFRAVGFKRCCMRSGRYDGAERNHFFPRMIKGAERCLAPFFWAVDSSVASAKGGVARWRNVRPVMPVSIVAFILAIATTVSPSMTSRPANPPYMKPPVGWRSLGPPPPDAPIDYGWVSPHFRDGTPHAGDSMEAWVRPVPVNSTLADQVRELIADETQDRRVLASSHSHATCSGSQPGWTVDLRLALSPSITVSQVFQLAVSGGRVYVINFNHRADLPIDPSVQASLDSLCPKIGA